MSKAKAVRLEFVGATSNQQRLWESIRSLRDGFEVGGLALATDVPVSVARRYLRGLEAAGYVQVIDGVYCLTRDCGVEAPLIGLRWQSVNSLRRSEAMWRALRIAGEVSATELAAMASAGDLRVRESMAAEYLSILERAGYLRTVDAVQCRGQRRYRIIPNRCTGARPPTVQHVRMLFDPNVGSVVWHSQVEETI